MNSAAGKCSVLVARFVCWSGIGRLVVSIRRASHVLRPMKKYTTGIRSVAPLYSRTVRASQQETSNLRKP